MATAVEFRKVNSSPFLNRVIVLTFFMTGTIITLISTAKFLKGKSSSKVSVGVLNLFFGGIIGGILILIGIHQQNNLSKLMLEKIQNDKEYQEYLHSKNQDKNK